MLLSFWAPPPSAFFLGGNPFCSSRPPLFRNLPSLAPPLLFGTPSFSLQLFRTPLLYSPLVFWGCTVSPCPLAALQFRARLCCSLQCMLCKCCCYCVSCSPERPRGSAVGTPIPKRGSLTPRRNPPCSASFSGAVLKSSAVEMMGESCRESFAVEEQSCAP